MTNRSEKMGVLFRLLLIGGMVLTSVSCCSRPYTGGAQSWPEPRKYPDGPYKYLLKNYQTQTGICPDIDSVGTRIRLTVWDSFEKRQKGRERQLFSATFRHKDYYYDEVFPKWGKDGSIVIVGEKDKKVLKRYPKVSEGVWKK